MKKYEVVKREVWTNTVMVEAETPEEAVDKARDEEGLTEFSYHMGSEKWDVTELKEGE